MQPSKHTLGGFMITWKTKINALWNFFLHSRSPLDTIHLKFFHKTLILVFEANSASSHQITVFSLFQLIVWCDRENTSLMSFLMRLNCPIVQKKTFAPLCTNCNNWIVFIRIFPNFYLQKKCILLKKFLVKWKHCRGVIGILRVVYVYFVT